MAAAGTPQGYGVALGRPEDMDAATAYNLELSRQMQVPEKIVVADNSAQHQSPAVSASLPANAAKWARVEDTASSSASPMLDSSRRMHVPERISYGEATGTPDAGGLGRGRLRGHLPDFEDRAMHQSPALSMVTPPDRLTVTDQHATPPTRRTQPQAASAAFSADRSGEVVSRDEEPGFEANGVGQPGLESFDEDNGDFDEVREEVGEPDVVSVPRSVLDRLSALEQRVAELERNGGRSPGMQSGDRALAVMMFAFWVLNPLMIFFWKRGR